MIDHGYPQITEVKILKEYIKTEAHKMAEMKNFKKKPETLADIKVPIAASNAVGWRNDNVKHSKNEVYLDVVERLNILVSAEGNVIKSEILGAVKMRSMLSGMPELKLGLNDKVLFDMTGRTTRGKLIEMEDIKFH